MLYPLLRPLLFSLDAERAHDLTLGTLSRAPSLIPAQHLPARPVQCMGLTFPNPVGLAAGLDKNGAAIDGLARLGFGFIEIGTITPRPQPGNPKPRMFRLPAAQGIINRMGFNNLGLDVLIRNVERSHFVRDGGILGINIGKNADTPIERAVDDYLIGLRGAHAHASYITVNISSPNTKNLRQLQGSDELNALLGALDAQRRTLDAGAGRRVPLALKIAPDLDEAHELLAESTAPDEPCAIDLRFAGLGDQRIGKPASLQRALRECCHRAAETNGRRAFTIDDGRYDISLTARDIC